MRLPFEVVVIDDFGDAEEKANGNVGEGDDGANNGMPQIWSKLGIWVKMIYVISIMDI